MSDDPDNNLNPNISCDSDSHEIKQLSQDLNEKTCLTSHEHNKKLKKRRYSIDDNNQKFNKKRKSLKLNNTRFNSSQLNSKFKKWKQKIEKFQYKINNHDRLLNARDEQKFINTIYCGYLFAYEILMGLDQDTRYSALQNFEYIDSDYFDLMQSLMDIQKKLITKKNDSQCFESLLDSSSSSTHDSDTIHDETDVSKSSYNELYQTTIINDDSDTNFETVKLFSCTSSSSSLPFDARVLSPTTTSILDEKSNVTSSQIDENESTIKTTATTTTTSTTTTTTTATTTQNTRFVSNCNYTAQNSMNNNFSNLSNYNYLYYRGRQINAGDDANFDKIDDNYDSKIQKLAKIPFSIIEFRPYQLRAINALLLKNDCILSMGTGTGKSIIYQIPTLISEKCSIVILPNLSLINDQMDKLIDMNINCASLSGSQNLTIIKH